MKRSHQENDVLDDLRKKDNKMLKLSSSTSSQEENASCTQENDSIPSRMKQMPSDCLVHIFEYCPAPELSFTAPLVCRTWHNIISLPHVEELLWKQLCLNEWPVLLSIPTSATQIENDSFLNRGGFKSWKQFFHRYATVIPPLLHENVHGTITGAMNLPSTTGVDMSNGIRSYLETISCLVSSVTAKLDKFDHYQLNHKRCMALYRTLVQQAKHDEDESINQKMEQLFLDRFKLLVDSKRETKKDYTHGLRSATETKTLTILGPSGQLIQIDLAFHVSGSVSGYSIDDIRDQSACCSVKLLGRPKEKRKNNKKERQQNDQSCDEEEMEDAEVQAEEEAAMVLYRQTYEEDCEGSGERIPPNFLSDMNTIRKHLGLQHLSIEALWSSIIEQLDLGHDNDRYYEEMKEMVQGKLSYLRASGSIQ